VIQYTSMDQNKDILSVSNSILLSGILIAISIFWSSNNTSSEASQKQEINVQQENTEIIDIVSRADEATEGDGEVVVYEFSDFQCPFCQQFWNTTYKQIKEEYVDTNKITFIYRQFPIASLHPSAHKAAEASECANDQNKFWQYHDLLFENGKSNGAGLDIPSLKRYASDLSLDTNEFNKCLDGGEKTSVVNADIQMAGKVGISGTPSFIINGQKHVGALSYTELKQIIDQALSTK